MYSRRSRKLLFVQLQLPRRKRMKKYVVRGREKSGSPTQFHGRLKSILPNAYPSGGKTTRCRSMFRQKQYQMTCTLAASRPVVL
jgi:hypothetical protein